MQPQNFDTYAPNYDEHFTHSLIGKEQRKQVYNYLKRLCDFKFKRVLEINCGTGEDAIWLAQQGATIIATDISKGMIDVAKGKPSMPRIVFKVLSTQEIGSLYPEKFEIIFSNFGGLNCLSKDDLIKFKSQCDSIQESGNVLMFVIMGSNCIWEKLFFKWKNELIKANRRQNKKGTETSINQNNFLTYYYSPKEMIDIFKDSYNVIFQKPIGLFVPPSYLEDYFKRKKILFNCLILLDKLFGRISAFANNADHYLIMFEKK